MTEFYFLKVFKSLENKKKFTNILSSIILSIFNPNPHLLVEFYLSLDEIRKLFFITIFIQEVWIFEAIQLPFENFDDKLFRTLYHLAWGYQSVFSAGHFCQI